MNENIFKDAHFGKAYKTRDERQAIYSHKEEGGLHVLMYDNGEVYSVHSDGYYHNMQCFTNLEDYTSPLDIISEWQPTVDEQKLGEEKLDKLAKEEADLYGMCFLDSGVHTSRNREGGFQDGFKVGYRKAKESILKFINSFSKEELDRLANEYICNYGCERYDDGVEAYKAGFKEAEKVYEKYI